MKQITLLSILVLQITILVAKTFSPDGQYHEIQKKLMEDLPAIPLFGQKFPTAYRPNIAGLPPDNRDPVWGIDAYPIYFKD